MVLNLARVATAQLAAFGLALCFSISSCAATDPVVLTFSTVGDSRQDPVSPDPTSLPVSAQDQMWLQNTKAWSRIMRSIQAQKPAMLFFNGDMIMGYGRAAVPEAWASTPPSISQLATTDLVKFYIQYAFWRGMVAPLMETGIYIVPVPGNHETQCNSANQTDLSNQPSCPSGKVAQIENEQAWAANMGDLILDTTRLQNIFGAQAPTYFKTNPGIGGVMA